MVRKSADKVIARIDPHAAVLVLEGNQAGLRLLGENIRNLAMLGEVGEHLHVEYFPDHFYIGELSLPLVFHLLAGSDTWIE